jgi:hypothetical protein
MDDFAASNKFTDDDPLPAVEGGEKTALQAFDDMCDLYKARIRELEATLRAYICNESIPTVPMRRARGHGQRTRRH